MSTFVVLTSSFAVHPEIIVAKERIMSETDNKSKRGPQEAAALAFDPEKHDAPVARLIRPCAALNNRAGQR